MFSTSLKEIMESVFDDANKLKKDKENVATMRDRRNKQLYYVLTEEQFDLMFRKIKKGSPKK